LFVDSVLPSSIPPSLRRFSPLFVDSNPSLLIPSSLRRFRLLFVDSALSSSIPFSSALTLQKINPPQSK
ncbi:hypothetical protein, partial [Alkalicoccobacillus gibsonii]|uniref:hypothetical protein n=1 Tax=Alkalicoccobacillus gibsonii TaxID=79881 RepID=UPI00235FB8DD